MGPGETIGLIAVVVLMIVVIGVASEAYRRRLNFKQRELELRAAGMEHKRDAADVELIEKLEQRLRVLERIATDRDHIASTSLAAEIEDLRRAKRTEGELQ